MRNTAPKTRALPLKSRAPGNSTPKLSASVKNSLRAPDHFLVITPSLVWPFGSFIYRTENPMVVNHINFYPPHKILQNTAGDTLRPDCRQKNKTSTPIIQKGYSNDELSILHCIQLEGSPSSLYSFCIYGVLGFYPPAVRA